MLTTASLTGGWWGTGKRGGKLSQLLCGLQDGENVDRHGNQIFLTICKIGSGMNLMD